MLFSDVRQAERLVDAYFKKVAGEFHYEHIPAPKKPEETIRQKVWDRESEPATITGLALHLGFDSLGDLESYEKAGEFAPVVKRGRLRVESEYEKKLHQQSPTGAIFALKNLGWTDRDTNAAADNSAYTITVNMTIDGIPTAGNERDVIM